MVFGGKDSKRSKKRPRRISAHSSQSLIPWAVAASAVVAIFMFGARNHSAEQNAVAAPITVQEEQVLIPVPLRSIARGEKLEGVEFAEIKWPKNKLSGNYLKDLKTYRSFTALTALPAHLPIPLSAVGTISAEANAVVEGIPQGMRAITVKVDLESAVEGWARSGSFVDVIVLRQSKEADLGVEARVIAENVKILSAGRSTVPLDDETTAPTAPATVTLLASQEDALKIKTAMNIGRLTFALRGIGDGAPSTSLAMNQKTLLGSSKIVTPRKEVIRGKAKGPDGRTYVLGENSSWVATLNPQLAPGGAATNSTPVVVQDALGEVIKDQNQEER